MSVPGQPKKQSRTSGEDDSENEELVEIIPADEDEDDTASEQTDDDTHTTNESSSEDDDDDDDGENDDIGGDAEVSEGDGDSDGGGGGGEGGGEGASGSKKNIKKRRAASKKNPEDDLTLLGVPHGIHFDDDDDDEDDDDENEDKDSSEYFQKLKSNVRESYISTYHPESFSHNYDEIQTLSRVVRNSAGIIVDDLHRTIPIMTKYEKTRVLGQRAKQLNEGAPAFIKIDSTVIDGYLIAVKELEQKKTPFIIRRPLPNGGSEYWRIQDLEII
jgi:DNA-directed RNA polymerase subunit K/omega